MVLICLLLIPVSIAVSMPLTRWLVSAGERWGHIDQPGREAHKQHGAAIPNTGGIAIFLAVAAPMAAGLIAIWVVPIEAWKGWLAPVGVHAEGLRGQSANGCAVIIALGVLHVLGLIDDRRQLSVKIKLFVQAVVAGGLSIFFEIRVLEFLHQWGPMGYTASIVISVLWLVTITNALNMLDNMDGLAGGVGAIIAGLYLLATLHGGQWFIASLCALLLGALTGFLRFNFPPARIFMGDGGSLVLGMLLGVISIRTTYVQLPDDQISQLPAAWHGVLMPMVVMAVPLYDLASVVLIRLHTGRSPFVGDRNHFSHRLLRRGLSVRLAVLVIYLTTIATGLGGIMLTRLAGWQALLVGFQTLAVLTVLAILELHDQGGTEASN